MECCAGPHQKVMVAPLTEEELDAITVVFHQYETGLREGTIYTKVRKEEGNQTLIALTLYIKWKTSITKLQLISTFILPKLDTKYYE